MYPNANNAPYSPYDQQQQYPPSVGFPQPSQQPPYPTSQPGYPTSQPGYPTSQPGYPTSQPGYPTSQPGYPPQAGYPGAAPPYPQQTPYPQAGAGYPSVPPASYPAPGGFGSAPAYPPSPFGQTQPHSAGQLYGQQPPVAQQQQHFGQAQAYPAQQQQQHQQHYPAQAYPAAAAPHSHGASTMNRQNPDVPGIRPVQCDAQADAQVLRKAMKGFGTDEKAIINILTKRSDQQRQAICTAFKASFGKDLIKDLKSELGGKLEDVIVSLMTPRIDYLAQMLRKAVSGIGTKESLLVDTLCTASNSEIQQICAAYVRIFGVPLEKDLKGDTSGHFMRLLVSICTGSRSEDPYVNQALATEDAQKLLNAGEKMWGTDESMFNMILATRSYGHLRTVFHEYERLTGHGFERAIQNEFSGDVQTGMMAIVKCAKSRAGYFASRLHDSLAGMGTKDNDLIFIMVSRADIDLGSIAVEYQNMYGKPLSKDISGDTSGDYKNVLLGLLGL